MTTVPNIAILDPMIVSVAATTFLKATMDAVPAMTAMAGMPCFVMTVACCGFITIVVSCTAASLVAVAFLAITVTAVTTRTAMSMMASIARLLVLNMTTMGGMAARLLLLAVAVPRITDVVVTRSTVPTASSTVTMGLLRLAMRMAVRVAVVVRVTLRVVVRVRVRVAMAAAASSMSVVMAEDTDHQ